MSPRPSSPNRERLLRTALAVGPVLDELVFVGGQVTELLVTEPATAWPRPTDDTDVVVRASSASAYRLVRQRLEAEGFRVDTREGAPVCRMVRDDLVLDVMPLDGAILGFTSRWHRHLVESAMEVALTADVRIRVANPASFLAAKWEAYHDRGAADPFASHDLEDIIALVAGVPTIVEQVRAAPDDVRAFIGGSARAILGEPWVDDVLEGNLPEAGRLPGLVPKVRARFEAIAVLQDPG